MRDDLKVKIPMAKNARNPITPLGRASFKLENIFFIVTMTAKAFLHKHLHATAVRRSLQKLCLQLCSFTRPEINVGDIVVENIPSHH